MTVTLAVALLCPPRPSRYHLISIAATCAHRSPDTDLLRAEIAVAAARLIAEDGIDYGSAKRKAAKQLLGVNKINGDLLPDNAVIEEEVRLHQALFLGDTQPARLRSLRKLALRMMTELAQFSPYITGAVLNGTAGEHSDIHLQLFTESPKDVEIFLLNKNIQFDVTENPHFRSPRESVETLSFLVPQPSAPPEGVHLSLYHIDDLRGSVKSGAGKKIERADIAALQRLMAADEVAPATPDSPAGPPP